MEALRWLTTVHRDQAVLRVASPTAVYTRRPGNHLDRYVRSAMMTQASLQQSYTFVEEEAKLRLIAAMKRRSGAGSTRAAPMPLQPLPHCPIATVRCLTNAPPGAAAQSI